MASSVTYSLPAGEGCWGQRCRGSVEDDAEHGAGAGGGGDESKLGRKNMISQ